MASKVALVLETARRELSEDIAMHIVCFIFVFMWSARASNIGAGGVLSGVTYSCDTHTHDTRAEKHVGATHATPNYCAYLASLQQHQLRYPSVDFDREGSPLAGRGRGNQRRDLRGGMFSCNGATVKFHDDVS